jgi:hypothetical protein
MQLARALEKRVRDHRNKELYEQTKNKQRREHEERNKR